MKSYELTDLSDVERYWWNLYEICLNTPLGGSSNLLGQEITLEVRYGQAEQMLNTSLGGSAYRRGMDKQQKCLTLRKEALPTLPSLTGDK
jgi:hypothetical protein